MSTSEPHSFEIGTVLADRFKIEAQLPQAAGTGVYAAQDQKANEPCVVLALSEQEATALRPFLKVHHAHLAALRAVEETDQGFIAAADRVGGRTLAEPSEAGEHAEAVVAVRAALRIADALSNAHAEGARLGRLHPGAIVMHPDGSEGPMLRFAGAPPLDSPYRSPQRGDGAPSETDDAWAVAALLFKMLTGNDPPAQGVESEDALLELGVADAALRTCLWHALNADAEARDSEIRPLKRALARWFVDHAGEDEFPSHSGSLPPPLPASQRSSARGASPMDSSMTLKAKKSGRKRLPVLAVGGLAVGLAAAWAVSMLLSEPAAPVAVAPPEPSAKASASAEAIDLSEVAVSGEERDEKTVADDKLSACVMSYLPKETFGKSPNVEWACTEKSARTGANKLRAEVVARAPKGSVSTAMRLFSKMGAYDQLAFSVVRAGCCPDAPALALPDPSNGCERMAEIVNSVGKQVVDGQAYESSLSKFAETLECEVKAGRGAEFRGNTPAAHGGREAFVEYVAEFEKPQ